MSELSRRVQDEIRRIKKQKRRISERKIRVKKLVVTPPRKIKKDPLVPTTYRQAKRLYNTPEYKEWRIKVFTRDNFQCQMCSSTGTLEAHHIKRKYDVPELTLVVSNGITLCKYCHQSIVTNNEKQFEFIFARIVKLNEERI